MSTDRLEMALGDAKEQLLNALAKAANEGSSEPVLNFAEAYAWLEHPEVAHASSSAPAG